MGLAPDKKSTNTPFSEWRWRTVIKHIFPTVVIFLHIGTREPSSIIRDFV
jgi:hypothetical protein